MSRSDHIGYRAGLNRFCLASGLVTLLSAAVIAFTAAAISGGLVTHRMAPRRRDYAWTF